MAFVIELVNYSLPEQWELSAFTEGLFMLFLQTYILTKPCSSHFQNKQRPSFFQYFPASSDLCITWVHHILASGSIS